jgi:CheY-like chemotaxis protein
MSAEVMQRAFEPFFTTKAGGHGTGLGLSMVYGFAMQSGGAVTIASTPGQGTTVTLFLPLGSREAKVVAPSADPAETPARCCTILVVEDEADVRSVVRRQLESLGHRVIVAAAAAEALLLLEGSVVPDLLLADVILASGMSGIDLVQAARAGRPDLPVIFMSGYTAVPDARERIRETGAQLLAKPFTTPQLDRAVNAACAQLMADG